MIGKNNVQLYRINNRMIHNPTQQSKAKNSKKIILIDYYCNFFLSFSQHILAYLYYVCVVLIHESG